MTIKEIEKCIMLLFCMFMLLITMFVGLITGLIKIKEKVEEIENSNLQVHEYILNKIETK